MSKVKSYDSGIPVKRSPFSLIELMIVLTIIGIFIVGTSTIVGLVKGSKLRDVISEVEVYNSNIDNFYNQFGQFPGDYGVFINDLAAGNENGKIEYINTDSISETVVALKQMIDAKIIKNHLTLVDFKVTSDNILPSQLPDVNIPSANVSGAGLIFDYFYNRNNIVLTGAIGSLNNIKRRSQNSISVISGAITPTYALSIDNKIDDGSANSGKIRGVLSSCFFNSTYITTNSKKECALAFEIN